MVVVLLIVFLVKYYSPVNPVLIIVNNEGLKPDTIPKYDITVSYRSIAKTDTLNVPTSGDPLVEFKQAIPMLSGIICDNKSIFIYNNGTEPFTIKGITQYYSSPSNSQIKILVRRNIGDSKVTEYKGGIVEIASNGELEFTNISDGILKRIVLLADNTNPKPLLIYIKSENKYSSKYISPVSNGYLSINFKD